MNVETGFKSDDILARETLRFSLMRIILILLVVYVHFPIEGQVSESHPVLYAISSIPLLMQSTFLRFSVVVLTAISGFIMFYKHQDQNLQKTVKKKFYTLIVPFIFWNIPIALALFVFQTKGFATGQRLNLATADFLGWADALFSLRTRPVNYPLYFIRDLFVVSLIGLVFSKVIRKYPLFCILVSAVICEYNADGFMILRTQMLTAFLIGAAIAVYKVPLNSIDKGFGIYSVLIAALCVLQYNDESRTVAICLVFTGGLWAWSFSAWALRYDVFRKIARYSGYAFPIYLIHGILISALLMVGVKIYPTPSGFLVWLVLPLAVALMSAFAFYVMKSVTPRLASFVTGGRQV